VSSPAPERETLGLLLRAARDRLHASGVEDANIEAELLMRQALRRPDAPLPTRAWLLPRLGGTATGEQREQFEALVARRLSHEPSAYITGVREFAALDFEVTPDVLIPRPETELLVATAVEWAYGRSPRPSPFPGPDASTLQRMRESKRSKDDPLHVVDIGTGSGAIAIALARALPAATVTATDVSWPALDVARRNAQRHGVGRRIAFRHGDLLTPITSYVDLIVANLPYVSASDWQTLAPEVRDHEPALALRAGDDGLSVIRALLRQAPCYLRPGGAICLEFGAGQAPSLQEEMRAQLPTADLRVIEDFAAIPRVLIATLPRRVVATDPP
jgi:release factor glutamine methyltransferase